MRRLKVLHIITHLGVGGAQDNTLLTVKGLDRTRFEVHVAGAPGSWEPRARAVADRLILIPGLRREIAPVDDLLALNQILTLLRREQYCIVHTHSSKAGIIGRLAARLARVPVVVHSVHGFSFDDATFTQRQRAVFILLERMAARWCDRLITVSQMTKQLGLAERIAPDSQMVTIYSGIDLTSFADSVDCRQKRRDMGLDETRPVIGTVGRLAPQTAPEVFVEAAFLVLKERPDVQCLIVGDGPSAERAREIIGGDERIKMTGYRADVPEILQTLDCFVSTAAWGAVGRALTEAMIVGLPVVATSIRGVPEIVKDGETGLLVAPGDAAAIADRVLFVLDHPADARRLGRSARHTVTPEFCADLMVERITGLYDSLLAAKGLA